MYVKVTAGTDYHGELLPDVIFEADGMVESGVVVVDPRDTDPDFETLIGRVFNEMTVGEIDRSNPVQDADGQEMALIVRWAGWTFGGSYRGVVTTRNIFLVGANGKTIDRV